MNLGRAGAGNAPVHYLSALVLALADWSATGLNIATWMDAYWPVVAACAFAAGAAIFAIEWRLAGATVTTACIKAACAVALVSIPLPFAGTLVAAVLLAWWLYGWIAHRA